MNGNEGSMDVLHQLLSERTQYQDWLAQLSERQGSAPVHVLERVKQDYVSRLTNVVTQLRGRAVELERSTADLSTRLAALAAEEATRRDERAEAEIREAVGEYAADRARDVYESCDAALGKLVEEQNVLGSELAKLQDVLEQVRATPDPISATAPADESPDDNVVSIQDLQMDEDAAPAPVAAQESNEPALGRDELDFLRSVVAPATADASGRGAGDMLAPPTLSAPRRGVTPLSTAVPQMRDPLREALGETSETPSSVASFLKDVPSEQVKTLKCQECGTMNFPTEWYCERCGGELASM